MMSPEIALHDPVFRAYLLIVPAFARPWWRGSQFPPMGLKEGAGLDLEHLSLLACNGVDRVARCFCGTRSGDCRSDIAFDFWLQGIRALFWIVSRLVDDRRRLRRHRCGRLLRVGYRIRAAKGQAQVRTDFLWPCRYSLSH